MVDIVMFTTQICLCVAIVFRVSVVRSSYLQLFFLHFIWSFAKKINNNHIIRVFSFLLVLVHIIFGFLLVLVHILFGFLLLFLFQSTT